MYIHNYKPAFTTIELIHVAAVSLVIGTIAIVDLRLIGLASTKRPFRELARATLPWTWVAFAIAAVSGSLLFISQATEYFGKTVFQVKLFILLLAGINMLVFELITARRSDFAQLLGPHHPLRPLDRIRHAAGMTERVGAHAYPATVAQFKPADQ